MKCILIVGTYKSKKITVGKGLNMLVVDYDINLYGNTSTYPEIQLITSFKLKNSGYDDLERVCRQKFAKYFGVSEFDIVSMLNIYEVK